MQTLEEFKASIRKLNGHRKHKVTGSIGVYSAYKYFRKNKWEDIGQKLTEKEFYAIIRKVGNYLAANLCNGEEVKFPACMGTLELRKFFTTARLKGNKVVDNFNVDWDATLKLWYEDPEAFKKKQIVKSFSKEAFKVFYNKYTANYTNQTFYEFQVNRDIKRTIGKRVKQGLMEAHTIKEI